MGFDLSKVLEQAQQVTEDSSASGGGDYARIVYPGPGELKVKLLLNPKSGIVARQTRRHTIDGDKITCMNMYSQDCPICMSLKSIETALGKSVPWTMKSTFRGLSYAQYVGSSEGYDWGSRGEPEKGELVLLMYPWSVYSVINEIIASAGINAGQLISENESKVFVIKRVHDGNRVEYKVSVDPFDSFKSFETDEEFIDFMNELPDLSEAIEPREMDQETLVKSQEVANALEMQYLGQRMGNSQSSPMSPGAMQQAPAPQPQQPVQPAQTLQPDPAPVQHPTVDSTEVPTSVGGDKPECFGQHKEGDVKCLSCLHEHECTLIS